jgi:hypothetical protein
LSHRVFGELGRRERPGVFSRAGDQCRDGVEVVPVCLQGGSPALFAFCSAEGRGEGPPAARAPLAVRRRAARFMAGRSG